MRKARNKSKDKEGSKSGTAGTAGRHRKKTSKSGVLSMSARPVIIAILLIVFAGLAVGPVSRNLEATSSLRNAEKELQKERETTESLRGEVERARSLDYVEQEARSQRLVAPGEVLYLVTSEEDEADVEYRIKSVQSMDEAWERVRQMLNCTHRRSNGGD